MWVQPPLEVMHYYLLIFLFLRFDNKAKSLSAQYLEKFDGKWRTGVLTRLPLPTLQDTAWSWYFLNSKIYIILHRFVSQIFPNTRSSLHEKQKILKLLTKCMAYWLLYNFKFTRHSLYAATKSNFGCYLLCLTNKFVSNKCLSLVISFLFNLNFYSRILNI